MGRTPRGIVAPLRASPAETSISWATSPYRRRPVALVNLDPVQSAQVEHDPVRQRRIAGIAVATAAGARLDAMRRCEPDGVAHIPRVDGTRNGERHHRVKSCVEDVSRTKKPRLPGQEHVTSNRPRQPAADPRGRERSRQASWLSRRARFRATQASLLQSLPNYRACASMHVQQHRSQH